MNDVNDVNNVNNVNDVNDVNDVFPGCALSPVQSTNTPHHTLLRFPRKVLPLAPKHASPAFGSNS